MGWNQNFSTQKNEYYTETINSEPTKLIDLGLSSWHSIKWDKGGWLGGDTHAIMGLEI
jgi:hypothetical protein